MPRGSSLLRVADTAQPLIGTGAARPARGDPPAVGSRGTWGARPPSCPPGPGVPGPPSRLSLPRRCPAATRFSACRGGCAAPRRSRVLPPTPATRVSHPGWILRAWKAARTARWRSCAPGAGPSRICSTPAPCPPPSPAASPALPARPPYGMYRPRRLAAGVRPAAAPSSCPALPAPAGHGAAGCCVPCRALSCLRCVLCQAPSCRGVCHAPSCLWCMLCARCLAARAVPCAVLPAVSAVPSCPVPCPVLPMACGVPHTILPCAMNHPACGVCRAMHDPAMVCARPCTVLPVVRAVHHPALRCMLCRAPSCPWCLLCRAPSYPVPCTIACTVHAMSCVPADPWCAPSARLCLGPRRGCAMARATRAASCATLRAVSRPASRARRALPTRSSSVLPSPSCPRRLPVPLPAVAALPPLAPALALPPRPGVTRPVSASRAGPPPLWLCSLSLSSAPASPLARRVSTGCPGPARCSRWLRSASPPASVPLALWPLLSASAPPKAPLSPCCPHPGPHRGPAGPVPARVSAGGPAPAVRGSRSPAPRVPPSYGTLPSRRALKNSRLVSQKDDVHLCIMCLRAIMNYQVPQPRGGGMPPLPPHRRC